MSINKRNISLILVLLLFINLLFSSYEILHLQYYKIAGIVKRIYEGKYRYHDVRLANINRLERRCLSLLDRPGEKIAILRFNYEHNCEILRYYLYPKHEAYILERVDNLATIHPYYYLRGDYNRDVKTLPQLLDYMKENQIRFIAVPDRYNPSYENVVNNIFFKPVAYENEWVFYRLKDDNGNINQDGA